MEMTSMNLFVSLKPYLYQTTDFVCEPWKNNQSSWEKSVKQLKSNSNSDISYSWSPNSNTEWSWIIDL